MILDAQNLFGQDQAVTATANATTDLDLGPIASGNSKRDIGTADDLYFVVICTQTATAAGAATVTVTLQTDDNSAFSSANTIFSSKAFALADMVAGAQLVCVSVPKGVEKYLRVNYAVATGPLTAGTFSAFLVTNPQDSGSYAAGYAFPSGA